MFLFNKYHTWYNNIVQAAKSRSLTEKFDRHHIIPKSLGGSNDHNNIVKLTYREHFICHWLLTKFTTGDSKRKMVFAAWQQSRPAKHKNLHITSRTYAHLRSMLSETYTGIKRSPFSEKTKENMRRGAKNRKKVEYSTERIEQLRQLAISRKGIPLSDDHKEKISGALRGREFSKDHKRKISDAKTGKSRQPFSIEWREKISISNKGKTASSETRKKMSESNKGKNLGKPGPNPGIPRSDEVKRKISETKRNAPDLICPHCGKIGKGGNMKRYHFEECKSLIKDIRAIPPTD